MKVVNIYDAISVEEKEGSTYPFNYKFSTRYKGPEVEGPGIYIISFEKQPIYLGKFQPFQRNNILNDRWLRHMETITLRGSRLGFGKNATMQKISRYLSPEILLELAKMTETELGIRLRDTGVCTSRRRCHFAGANWAFFKSAQPHSLLDNFELSFYKLKGVRNEREASEVTSAVERALIRKYDFIINHHRGISQITDIDDVVTIINKVLYDIAPSLSAELELQLKAK